MVAIDTTTGAPIRVGGAALVSGPSLVIRPDGRPPVAGVTGVSGAGGSAFPGVGNRREPVAEAWHEAQRAAASLVGVASASPAALQPQQPLPAMWGVTAFSAGALFGPPYELPDATMEWQVRADTLRSFRETDRASRMALRLHPRGPQLQTGGSFLSALYGMTPTPLYLGVGVDFAS